MENDITIHQPYNLNIVKALRLTREMISLADDGDDHRLDKSCGILYGLIRDTAYKIRNLAEKEKNIHINNGLWDINNDSSNEIK